MKIACLGWGSLIWRPENLLLRSGWFMDGPLLPIEYARQSKDGRLTLVITEKAKPVRTLWATMATSELATAKTSLRIREAIPERRLETLIGSVTASEPTSDNFKLTIQHWATNLNLDAVIWTNLPPKFKSTENHVPTIEEAISYLNLLDSDARKAAEEYVRKTPQQIDTDYRRIFETEFGWTFVK